MPARSDVSPFRPLVAAIALTLALDATGAAPSTPIPGPHSAVRSWTFEIDPDAIVAQANEAARATLEVQREFRELAQLHRDFDFDAASLAFVASELGHATEIVKNAPYTAEAVSESVQVLADGNRIVKQNRAQLARDSFGRTRQEKKGPQGTVVYVFDPIEGKSFVLNPDRRTAVRIPRVPGPPLPGVPAPTQPPSSVQPVPPTPPVPPAPPLPPARHAGSAQATTHVDGAGNVVVRRREVRRDDDVRVDVVRIDGAPLAPLGALTLPLLPRGKGETQNLGTRDFGGVKAEGTETRHTIPAGEIGNEKPIVITSERWFSPELHVVVFARTVDPRVGETSYRLANVKREEPAPDLFKVPTDFRSRAAGEPGR